VLYQSYKGIEKKSKNALPDMRIIRKAEIRLRGHLPPNASEQGYERIHANLGKYASSSQKVCILFRKRAHPAYINPKHECPEGMIFITAGQRPAGEGNHTNTA
jgi:hypothetical protein